MLLRMATTVVGKSCKDVELKTTNIIMLTVAFEDFLSCMAAIASIPEGVAAPPTPIRFAVMLSESNSCVRSSTSPNKNFVTGLASFESF